MESIRSLLEILPAILPLVITEGKVRRKFGDEEGQGDPCLRHALAVAQSEGIASIF